jgi:PAS domain S-box-containing protein
LSSEQLKPQPPLSFNLRLKRFAFLLLTETVRDGEHTRLQLLAAHCLLLTVYLDLPWRKAVGLSAHATRHNNGRVKIEKMPDPRPYGAQSQNRHWSESAPARYALAVVAAAAATLLMFALYAATGLQRGSVPFIFYFVAVIVVALYAGRGPVLLAIALSALVANYFFLGTTYGLALNFPDVLQTGVFVVVSLFISALADRSSRAEASARVDRESLQTTLRSIGDAVIATDAGGRVRFMNPVAERLTGWPLAEAEGRPLGEIFKIVNEVTRATVESPVEKVLREGQIVGLANYTVLLARDGTEVPIDDSGAPIRDERGRTSGVVLVFHDVTEQRKGERMRAHQAAIVESSSEAVIGKTLEGTVTSWNAAAERMYGYTAEEAIGRHISFIVPEELREDLADILSRLGRGERVERAETVRVTRDGSRLDMSLIISPIRDPSGHLVGASTVGRDITAQKRADSESTRLSRLVEHERGRLKNLVANVPGVVWEAWGEPDESSQRIDFVSEHVEQMLGYTVEEWLSTPNFWLSIVHPEDRERAGSEARAIFESREDGTSQFRWVHRDGRVVHVESQSRVVLDERGEPAGMRGVTMDITERKVREERLRFLAEASRVLGSSLDYETTLAGLARLAVAAMADYCLVDLVDDDGRVRRVAAAHADPARQQLAERLRAFPPGPQSAGIPRVLRTGRPEVLQEVTEEMIPALARDEEHARMLSELGLKSFVTVPLVTRGRTIGALTFSSTRASRRYADGDVAYAQEIASRAALAIENARLYARAQEVNRAKDEFLATLSHELRTPLTPILGWTHMIRSGRLGPAETAQGIRIIEKNSQSLSRLINDLLDMSSILSGKMRIEHAPVELAGVVREAAETVRPQADARSVSVEVQTGGLRPAVVSGDRTRLVQVFWNLLHNAVKFSREGGRVRVRVGALDGTARVEIEDEGAGIEPEFLPHVFERFRQADMGTTRAHGGLGLGLALVKSFVEAHGGSVNAESAGTGRGSRFTVALPAVESDGASRNTGDLEAGAGEPYSERSCHVLLIEDAPDTLEMLRVAFAARGYTSAACATPEEALRVAESGRFDIIVSDIGLPRIDGYDLIARLRELPHLRGVPALALTGYAAQRDAEAALAAGFDAHVPKPVDPTELAERMDQLTRREPSEPKKE